MSRKKDLYISIILFIICITICESQSSISDAEILFFDYSKKVENLIQDHDPLVMDFLDTLSQYETQVDTDFSEGLLNKIFGYYHSVITNDNKKALEFYSKSSATLTKCCYKHNETVNSLLGENGVLLSSGLYNYDTTFFKKGQLKVREALEIASSNKDTLGIVRCLDGLGDYMYYSAFKIQDMDSAIYYYKSAEKLIAKGNLSTNKRADNYLGLANVYRALNNYKKEEYYFNKSVEICDSFNHYGILFALYSDKSENYSNKGDYNEALRLELISYGYVKKSNNAEFINRSERYLYQNYKRLGDYKNALYYYEKYNNSLEEMHKDEALKFQSALETKRNLSLKEEEILKLEIRNSNNIQKYLIAIISLSLFTLLLSFWANNSLRKKNKALSQKNKEIILARLKGQNTERKRMAGELHDNLNTKVAAVRWQLEAFQETTEPNKKYFIGNLIDQLNDVYEDVRLISHNLMPETVETIGLIQAINDLVVKLNESDRVKFNLVTDLSMDENFNALSYPIYNIIFEMINNVLKHSQAANAWISISKNQIGDLKLSVSDDGKGFDVDQMKNGYGIKSITSRIENLNGQWSIESTPGNGTKIYVEVPNL